MSMIPPNRVAYTPAGRIVRGRIISTAVVIGVPNGGTRSLPADPGTSLPSGRVRLPARKELPADLTTSAPPSSEPAQAPSDASSPG
jgi:hypothetical protein